MPGLWLVTLVVALGQESPSTDGSHARTNERGARVMGFDQNETTHHFLLYPDGGAIRAHLPHIAVMFGEGSELARKQVLFRR
jgi:hypothetical protein